MRKLLLATVATLGASMGMTAFADAQVTADTSGQTATDTDGQVYPTPGTVTVRLNGRFREYAYVADNGAYRTSNFAQGAVGATTLQQGINKLDNYGFEGYARLYPGFDGVAANGLKYGASLEIRQDNTFGAGGGTDGSITGNDRTRGYLYFRREWGYIGTDRLGSVRFGASDNPESLFETGTGENFDDGGLNGDLQGFLASDGGIYVYPFADVGNMYSTNKLVYLSPQVYGFDFGLSFEPSTAGIGNDNGVGCEGPGPFGSPLITTSGGNGAASPGCDPLGATSTGDYTRRKDTYEGLVRYRGTFGPFGVVGTADYIGSGRVHDDGVVGSTTNPKRTRLEDLSVGNFGLAVTYGGLTVGGHYQVGRYTVQGGDGPGALLTRGQPDSDAYVATASYTIGPVIFGAAFSESWYQGNQQAATNRSTTGALLTPAAGGVYGGRRKDTGLAVGATYSLAPGVALYLSGEYQEARQRGVNIVSGATVGTAGNQFNNKVQSSIAAIGTSFAW